MCSAENTWANSPTGMQWTRLQQHKDVLRSCVLCCAEAHLLQSGQAERVFSQRWMQSRWNTWPQVPQAMLRPGWSASPARGDEMTSTVQMLKLLTGQHAQAANPGTPVSAMAIGCASLHPPVGLAWYSMLGSYRLLRQMAQVSVQIAQDHLQKGGR